MELGRGTGTWDVQRGPDRGRENYLRLRIPLRLVTYLLPSSNSIKQLLREPRASTRHGRRNLLIWFLADGRHDQ